MFEPADARAGRRERMTQKWMCVKCGFKFKEPVLLGKRKPLALCPKCHDRPIRELVTRNWAERRSCCGGR